MRIAVIAGIVGAAIVAAVLMMQLRPEPPKREREIRDPLVDIVVLEPMTADFRVQSQGTVAPRTETILSAEVSGTITRISPKFIAGGVFDAGEVLLRIDPTNYEVALEQAEALVRQRQIEFDGARKLREQGYRAEAEFASAAATRNLERTFIRVPYEGIVRSKETDIGQFVNPGTRLGVVFATDFAEVRLPLTDLDLAFVDLPTATDITRSGEADGPRVALTAVQKGRPVTWEAQIVRTEGVVDEKSRVTYAVARVRDPYRRKSSGEPLPMGTFVSADIAGARAENVIRVPRSTLRGSDQLLFVDEDSRLRIRSVDIVRADAEHVYLRDDELTGERVILTALETPINGMKVRTTADADAAAADEDPSVVATGKGD